mmetsp:Transcript_97881/g.292399  ORF Transcript_97881/g.292399 Transcript_97881/m.292399 type:complete len:228 (+) Transcript_97881:23-706(+)
MQLTAQKSPGWTRPTCLAGSRTRALGTPRHLHLRHCLHLSLPGAGKAGAQVLYVLRVAHHLQTGDRLDLVAGAGVRARRVEASLSQLAVHSPGTCAEGHLEGDRPQERKLPSAYGRLEHVQDRPSTWRQRPRRCDHEESAERAEVYQGHGKNQGEHRAETAVADALASDACSVKGHGAEDAREVRGRREEVHAEHRIARYGALPPSRAPQQLQDQQSDQGAPAAPDR